MVDAIQEFSGVIEGAVIRAQIVLIGCLHLTVTKNLRNLFPAQSRLNQPRRRGATQASETQSIWFAVFYPGPFTRSLERPFHRSNSKDRFGIILLRLFPKGFELETETITNRHRARLHGFSDQTRDVDFCFFNGSPLQRKDFTGSHSRVDRANQNGLQMFNAPSTGSEQSNLFFERQHAGAFTFLGDGDKGFTFAERALGDPPFTFGNVEKSAEQSEFPVNAGETPALPAFGLSAQSTGLVRLQIRVGDRTDSAIFEKRIQRARIAANGVTGAQTGDFTIIDVDWGDSVAIQVPPHDNREFCVGAVAAGSVQRLPFFERITQTIAGFGPSGTRAPESFALPVFHPGDAGVNVSVSDYDLDFMVAGHLLSDLLYVGKMDSDCQSNRGVDCDGDGVKNQGDLEGIDVLSWFGQDTDEEIDLTSDQKVKGSSPFGCTKTLSKSQLPKSQITSFRNYYPASYTFAEGDMPRIASFLYAVRMLVPAMSPQPLKIGFSTRPDQRKQSYVSGPFPCEWLGVWPGTIHEEQALHRRYAHLAEGLCGEWFLPDDEMLEYVSARIAAYQKRLDRYTRFAAQKAAWNAQPDKELRTRAARILEEYFDQEN